MQTVGIIGLGRMGLPIARNLIDRGFRVTGYRRHPTPELAQAGGTQAASPAEAAARADVIVSIVPEAGDVEQIVRGDNGTLTTLRPGTVHIEMSTVDVTRKAALRDATRARGGDLLDAPISGTPSMVAPRLATTFASGDRASVDKVKDVLDAISGRWVYTGPFGTGAQLKYIANLLLAVHTAAAAEALALARRTGLDLGLVQQTLDDSIASSAIWRQRGPVMAKRAWTPAPGPVATLHPILEQIEACAASSRLPTPVFAAAKAVFDQALADGCGDLDIACIHDQIVNGATS
jgi:3-hydroxyisobutyrate dehydrogenase-like beta-hydroxyacid dehydrogenase